MSNTLTPTYMMADRAAVIARKRGISVQDYHDHVDHGHVWCKYHRGWVRRDNAIGVRGPASSSGTCLACAKLRRRRATEVAE